MNLNYTKAVRYALKCGHGRDLVHDAYILWWDKHKRNIFDEKNGTVIRTIKNLIYREYTKSTFMSNGKVSLKKFYDIDYLETTSHDTTDHEALLVRVGFDDYDTKLAYNEAIGKAAELTGTYRTIYGYLSRGFTPTEIQEIEGISKSLVGYYRERLKLMLQ